MNDRYDIPDDTLPGGDFPDKAGSTRHAAPLEDLSDHDGTAAESEDRAGKERRAEKRDTPRRRHAVSETARAIGDGAKRISGAAIHKGEELLADERVREWTRRGTEAAQTLGHEAKRLSEAGMKIGSKAQNKGRKLAGALFGGDKVLWTIIIILLIFSMLLTFSATVYKSGGTPTSKLVHQLGYIVFGIVGLLFVHLIRYQFYGRIAKAVFIAGFILTVAAMLIGPEGAGARRDLNLAGVSFQPFEILKIGLIMVLAKQLARRQKNIEHTPILPSFNPRSWMEDAQGNMDILRTQTLPLLGPVVLTCLVTFLSVGNSTTLIIAVTCMVMLFIGRVRMADLGKIVTVAAAGAVLLFALGYGRSDTGRSRMASFKPDMLTRHSRLNSDSVEVYSYPEVVAPDGSITPAEANQSINAKMSIASGGFFGKGPGMSTHRSNLEEAERDFAYAFIIEEYGALGGLVILLLYLWFFFRTILIFKRCGTAFPSLLVLGLGLMIVLQAMIHMLVSVSLFPITGQQLPLISKGGSSLIFTLAALGMILGVSRQTNERTLDNPKGESLLERPQQTN